jgi:hypothetical protein
MSDDLLIPARSVFVDTSGLFALLSEKDGLHQRTIRIQPQLVFQVRSLVTTNREIAEIHPH